MSGTAEGQGRGGGRSGCTESGVRAPQSAPTYILLLRSYDCFEASDASIEAMNGQFLCNRPISVGYAFKKESKGGGCWGQQSAFASQLGTASPPLPRPPADPGSSLTAHPTRIIPYPSV